MIVPGTASQELSAALAAELGEPLSAVETTRFADGEFKVRVPAADDRAVVVASTVTSEAHVELLQLQDAVRDRTDEVVTVLPYMGYARQDSAFREGEPVSARAVARALSTGTDRVLTVNPHEERVCELFDVPAAAVDAAPALADPLPDDLREPTFVAPDEGAVGLAGTVRDAYGRGDTDHFVKERDRDTGAVTTEPSDADVAGRDVVLVDDIVATGGTMSEAIGLLHERDVGRVYVACVHPMLAADARARLARAGVAGVFGTDTLERPVSVVSAAPVLADALEG